MPDLPRPPKWNRSASGGTRRDFRVLAGVLLALGLAAALMACNRQPPSSPIAAEPGATALPPVPPSNRADRGVSAPVSVPSSSGDAVEDGRRTAADARPPRPASPDPQRRAERPSFIEDNPDRSLADLIADGRPFEMFAGVDPEELHRPLDETAIAAAGIRKLTGKHLTLYTDLPSQPAVDELPEVFDQAVPLWCAYFDLDYGKLDKWRMVGSVIADKALFRRVGLLPADLPPFRHGYQLGYELWVYEQPSDYYRRHLLLHEGTHGLMNLLLGGAGPPWYMEGMAEWFATHRWHEGRLTLCYNPRDRAEVEHWGRVKILKDEFAAGRALALPRIMQYGPTAHLDVEPYAWCWGAALFFENHPRYQDAFRELRRHVRLTGNDFNRRLYDPLADQWPEVLEQWQLFVANVEYGYDVAREAIDYAPGAPLPREGAAARIAADRGWQSSRVRLEAGVSYLLTAEGRYQVAADPAPWISEPGGVTIRYVRGRPLGMLLAAVRPDDFDGNRLTPLADPLPVGREATLTPAASGTLYLRINDSPAELDDNAGALIVRIQPR